MTVFWDVTPFSMVEGRNRQKQADLLNLPPAPAGFTFPRNVGLSPQYRALTTAGEYYVWGRDPV